MAIAAGIAAIFLAYLRMSRAMGVNADGASNALQAWDMLHGNILLQGWTVTDVSFYTNELILFMLAELVVDYHAGVVNVVAALTFTLLVVVVAVVGKGRATGREAVFRVALAVAVVGVPVLGLATSVQLTSPDHTGSAIPLLLTWLVVDRAVTRHGRSAGYQRWLPWAVAAMLAWGQIADPLIMYIGAIPLVVASIVRLRDGQWRSGFWRGLDGRLLLAGFGSVIIAQGVQLAIRLAGGFGAHAPPVELASPSDLPEHLWIALQALAGNFGGLFADRHGPVAVSLGALHLLALLAAVYTLLVVVMRALRRQPRHAGDRLAELVALGILVNLGAFVVSNLPGDLGTARQIVAVLPLSAVLIGRVWGPKLAAARLRARLVAAALMLVLAGELAVQATASPTRPEGQDVAQWLDSQNMHYGIGSYWNANNITLITGGRVKVVPITGDDKIKGYRWESRTDWYDPGLHDARFLVIDRWHTGMGSEATAIAQFGQSVARHDFSRATVFIYDHNLLVGLPAFCMPANAPSMAECPEHQFPLIP
ncbi:MAG TPA: hypothetical protein DGT23_21470 [Micromonosporaceae bacterium]|nr:hypothetical protein [Micromonosporaceae bacterium]